METKFLNPDMYSENETAYNEFFNNMENWNKIPLLNHIPINELKDLQLVRFRGMIQDMFNPEMYLEKYEVVEQQQEQQQQQQQQKQNEEENLMETSSSSPSELTSTASETNCEIKRRTQNGKYRDCLVLKKSNEFVNYESKLNTFGERRILFVITVPGINKWVTDIENDQTIQIQKEIQQNQNNDNTEPSSSSASTTSFSSSFGQKRSIPEENMDIDTNISNYSCNKKICTNNKITTASVSSSTILSSEYLLNSPIIERPSKACIVKIYSNFDNYKLNSIIDVIGFISMDPSLDGSTTNSELNDDNDFEINEIHATNPPPSLIPRLHAIAIKELQHVNPILDMNFLTNNVNENLKMETIRNDLKLILTQCLFGDDLAAEYLLLHLISTVYVRKDYETIGQITLNISNIPSPKILPEYTTKFYEILEILLTISHYFPMTLDNMNTIQFVPKKDYNTNRLTSGLLQLSSNTHLILDETKLEAGKLERNGINAIQSLTQLIKNQQLEYDFQYYTLNFDTNITILLLSEGKSMLPSDFQIPLNITTNENIELIMETLKAAKHYLQSNLSNIRKYLTLCKLKKFEINLNDDIKMIENDYCSMRNSNQNYGPNDLHSLLLLTHFNCISYDKMKFDYKLWEQTKQMEIQRKLRISQK